MNALVVALLFLAPGVVLLAAPPVAAFCQTQTVSSNGQPIASVTIDNGRGYTCRPSVDVYCHPQYMGGDGLHPGKVVLVCSSTPWLALP